MGYVTPVNAGQPADNRPCDAGYSSLHAGATCEAAEAELARLREGPPRLKAKKYAIRNSQA
jgi:hypothetical protein